MPKRLLAICLALAVVAGLVWLRLAPEPAAATASTPRIAVETVPVARGTLIQERSFPGGLEPFAAFTVAPKVAGRVSKVLVDIGDSVRRGQVVARLDDAEFVQAVAHAQAAIDLARAQLRQAESNRVLANQRLKRVQRLEAQGIAPASELDDAQAEADARAAAVAVAEANIAQAEAALETAQVRLGYTRITADWPGAPATRLVGQRMVDAGDTVAANTPLMTIIAVRQLRAVIHVPQSVYGRLEAGQRARIVTAANSGAGFTAKITRIAPRLDPASRQARVELLVDNSGRKLAPGMFVQVAIASARAEDAWIVPEAALVKRGGQTGVFTVAAGAKRAEFVAVEIALRSGQKVALARTAPLPGELVVLGQRQLEDGAPIVRPAPVPQ